MLFIILPPGVIGERRYSIRTTTQPLKKSYHHIALGSERFTEAVSQTAKRFEQKSEVNNEIKEYMQKVIMALKEV